MKTTTTIKLFVFESYGCMYFGGAVGVVAENFEQAVDLAVKEFTNSNGACEHKFQKNINGYEEDHYSQWLLSHELTIIEDGKPNPRILFDNWHEG